MHISIIERKHSLIMVIILSRMHTTLKSDYIFQCLLCMRYIKMKFVRQIEQFSSQLSKVIMRNHKAIMRQLLRNYVRKYALETMVEHAQNRGLPL